MNNKIIRFHFMIRILGALGASTLVLLSPYKENMAYLYIGVFVYVIFSIVLYTGKGVFDSDNMQVAGLFFDVLILSISIGVRGGMRSDFYLGYFLILGYAIHVQKKNLMIYLNIWIILIYTLVTYFVSAYGQFSVSRLLIRMTLLVGTMLLLQYYGSILNETEKIRDRAVKLAMFDTLTGAYNRRILENLEQVFAGEDFESYFALIDLDDFKKVNDTYGHVKGDEVLKVLSSVIQKVLNEKDMFIRYGGEEFLIILRTSDKADVYRRLFKAQQELKAVRFIGIPKSVVVTFTSGVSYNPSFDSVKASIKKADDNLYLGKNRGKDCIIFDTEEIGYETKIEN